MVRWVDVASPFARSFFFASLLPNATTIDDPALVSGRGGCREIVVVDGDVCSKGKTDAERLDFLACVIRLHWVCTGICYDSVKQSAGTTFALSIVPNWLRACCLLDLLQSFRPFGNSWPRVADTIASSRASETSRPVWHFADQNEAMLYE